jgi:tRNA U34 5-carboxymethylaminomethyl modifying GTPase MnmE/TrmE
MAAISSIALAGNEALAILEKVFFTGTESLDTGSEGVIFYGSIVDGQRVIDEVVVGCEGEDGFVIHCHGNPLLVEQVVTVLQSHGAELVDVDSLPAKNESSNMIEAEARLMMRKSATLAGVKILQAQIDGGLSQWASQTLDTKLRQEYAAQLSGGHRTGDRFRYRGDDTRLGEHHMPPWRRCT